MVPDVEPKNPLVFWNLFFGRCVSGWM